MPVGNPKRDDAIASTGFPWGNSAAGVAELAEAVFEGVSHPQDAVQPFDERKGEGAFFHSTAKQ